MTIEVRQMLIKSTVTNGKATLQADDSAALDLERLKQEVIAECKAWVEEWLRERQER